MGSFGVYKTVETDAEQFIIEDNQVSEQEGGPSNTLLLVPESFVGEHLDAIVLYHRKAADVQKFHDQLFVVIDSKDWRHEGVLLVNADLGGKVDSFHIKGAYGVRPGGVLNAIDVAAISWADMKQVVIEWAKKSSIESSASAAMDLVKQPDATTGVDSSLEEYQISSKGLKG